MKDHGFVIEQRRTQQPPDALHLSEHAGTTTIRGTAFQLSVRPFSTTPEGERERQPIVTTELVLGYTGRVDNRRDVAAKLGQPRLQSAADGEVIAAAYAAWGQDFPLHVLGEYSFVLVDRRTGALVAGVDSLGLGRLFSKEGVDAVWFSSDLDLLLAHLPEPAIVHRQSLVEYLGSWGRTPGTTIYAGIHEEPAAQVMTCVDGVVKRRRYWQPDPHREVRFKRTTDYDEALRSLTFDAVRGALRSNTPVSLDLSGGLDSSTVASVAATLTRAGEGPAKGLSAFSLVVSYPPEDNESAFQSEFLDVHPLPHRVLRMDEHLAFRYIDEDPPRHPSLEIVGASRLRATRALFASDGTRVSLTGFGGDQVFCGDQFPPIFLAESLQQLRLLEWYKGMRAWARLGDRSLWNLVSRCSRGPATTKFAGRREPNLPVWLTPDVAAAAKRRVRALPAPSLYRSPARELQYRLIMKMRDQLRFNGLGWEERHPLLHRPLVEFMLAIPWDQKVTPELDRVVQRRAFQTLLPDIIRLRTGKGEGKALLINGVREHWSTVTALLDDSRLARFDLVDLPQFRAACERLRHGLVDRHMGFFMAAFSLEAWLRWAENRGLKVRQAAA